MSAAVPLNKPYSYSGPFIVRNESDHTMVLDAAELVQVDPGISYLGAYAQEPSKYKTTIGVGEGYKGGQLRGFRVAPHAFLYVVFGVKVQQAWSVHVPGGWPPLPRRRRSLPRPVPVLGALLRSDSEVRQKVSDPVYRAKQLIHRQ